MKSINSETFKMMLLSGANNLYNNYPEIDALNVFPVPDGDTGMNMNLTMQSGAKEISNRNDDDIYTIAKVFSKGLLMGARGNSGVITSQIFRGIADGMASKVSIDAIELASAFENGTRVAYKAVIKPVEGTILTVIRESSEYLAKHVDENTSIEKAFDLLLTEARKSLERTPDLLPVLKEVGVVDSGGAGLIKILEGMQSALNGEFIDKVNATSTDIKGSAQVAADENNDEFGYCTEFIMRLGPDSVKRPFQKNRFTSVLNSHGNSLVVVQDEDIVKVHVHTLNPGNILSYAQNFGEFVKLKIENMTEQHNEILLNEMNKNNDEKSAAAKLKEAPLSAPKEKKETPLKEYALIATSSGKGIDEYFKEIGVDEIVSGGQTMNPSTNDFLEKIEKVHAKTVYLFPNNGNIILAANQARDVLEGKVEVVVIPTKTIMQGIVASMNFNPEFDSKINAEEMTNAIDTVKSGSVTFSIKDTEIDGVKVKKDEYMAIKESKNIISSHKNKFDALKDLVKHLVDEDSSILTILVGNDINDKELKRIEDYYNKEYKNIDCDIKRGDQPVYSFIVGVE